MTDNWLRLGNPWEVPRPERDAYDVGFYGRTEHVRDENGRHRVRWIPARCVQGVAYDTPVPGFGRTPPTCCGCGRPRPPSRSTSTTSTSATTTARWTRRSVGDHLQGAVSERRARGGQAAAAEAAVLLRLLLAAGHDPAAPRARQPLRGLPATRPSQLNDTHPSIAVAELMRLLVDVHEHGLGGGLGDHRRSLRLHEPHAAAGGAGAWPVALFGQLLPRHLEIVYEINRRFLDDVRQRVPGDDDGARLSLIDETGERSCAWRTSPRRQPRRSTAWPRCTPSCSRRPSSATSTRCCRSSSATSPTASPRGGGSRSPTPALDALITAHHRRSLDVGPGAELAAHRAARGRHRVPGGVAARSRRPTRAAWPP